MVTEIAGAGRTRESNDEIFYKQLLDATTLDDAGYVLHEEVEACASKVDLVGCGEMPYAVNYRSSRDPHDMNAHKTTLTLIGSEVGLKGVAVFRGGWAKLKVEDCNCAIIVGDPLIGGSGGCAGKVNKYVPTTIGETACTDQAANINARFLELSLVVGNAEEDVAAGACCAPGSDKVLTALTIGNLGFNPSL
jgi:hypothetical protein